MLNACINEWIATCQAKYYAQWGYQQKKHMTPASQKTMSDCGGRFILEIK